MAVLASSAACAQPRQPTGGPPIDRPLQVVAVSPEHFSTVTALNRPVVIRFDERLSERLEGVRELRDAVIVSPETGEVRVSRGRRELQISVAGGWQPGLVYRVVVLPVLRDLFNNVRQEPVELVFSTGPPIPETAVAGFIEDRLTGRNVRGARVEATHQESEHSYVTLSDSAGFFSLRHVPEGTYELQGWLDQNRNRVVDFLEPQDSARFRLAGQDTVILELALLPRDTTAARLTRASAIDSTKIELTFDDFFAPVPGPMDGSGRVYRLPDSVFIAEGTLYHATRLDSLRAVEEAARTRAETVAAGTETADPDPPLPARDAPGAVARRAPREARAPQRPLLARELILLLPAPLAPETRYFVVVEDVTNIQGVPTGGGTSPFRTEPRPPDPPPPPETLEDPAQPVDPPAPPAP
jgi:hypothetical protein